MSKFVVCGKIRPGSMGRTMIVAHNYAEFAQWVQSEGIPTDISFADADKKNEVEVIGQMLRAKCQDGDTVEYTVRPKDRKDKRIISGVDLSVVTAHEETSCPRRVVGHAKS